MTHEHSLSKERRGAAHIWRAIDRSQICSASNLLYVAERKSMPQNESISYIKLKQMTVSPKWDISEQGEKMEVAARGKKSSTWVALTVYCVCSKQFIVIKALVKLVLLLIGIVHTIVFFSDKSFVFHRRKQIKRLGTKWVHDYRISITITKLLKARDNTLHLNFLNRIIQLKRDPKQF